jgi:hypothetical protein
MLASLLLSTGAAFSQTITLSPTIGPPTTTVEISGSGFSPIAAVTISFGANSALATADGSGAFSNVAIQAPASALPGPATVSAAPTTGTGAQATFTVYTDWRQFGFAPNRPGFNPYENELSPTSVGKLVRRWFAFPYDANAFSAAAVVNGSDLRRHL